MATGSDGNPERPIDLVSHKRDETDYATKVFQRELRTLQISAHNLVPNAVEESLEIISSMIGEMPNYKEMREQHRECPEITQAMHDLKIYLQKCKNAASSFGGYAEQLANYLTNDRIVEAVRKGIERGDKDTVEVFFREVHRRQQACSQSLDIFVEEIEKKERESNDLKTSISNSKGRETTRVLEAEKREKYIKQLYKGLAISAVITIIPTAGIFTIFLGIFSFIVYKIFDDAKQDAEQCRKFETFYQNAETALFTLQSHFQHLLENMNNCQKHFKVAEEIICRMIDERLAGEFSEMEKLNADEEFKELQQKVRDLEINAKSINGHENIQN